MDCVECEKCKVFGKMQVYGIGVALKILFSDDSLTQVKNLQRNELIVKIVLLTYVINIAHFYIKKY